MESISEYFAWIPMIAAFGGAAISGVMAFALNWQNRRSDEKKHLREMMVNAALENWKKTCDLGTEIARKEGKKVDLAPLDSYLIHMFKFSEVLLDKKITKENIGDKIKEITEVVEATRDATP